MATSKGNDLFKTIADNLMCGIYVLQDQKFLYVNDRFRRIFGLPPAPVEAGTGTSYADAVAAGIFESVHEKILEEHDGEVSWWQQAQRPDGTQLWVEAEALRVTVHGAPAILGIVNDRTECKSIAEEMQASQETLQLLLDAMEDRVYVVTDDYRIVYANRKMQENALGDVTSDPCYRVCRGLDLPCDDCSCSDIFTNGEPIHREFFNKQRSAWYSVIELPVRMPGVHTRTKLAVARDITCSKEGEKKIRALSHRLLNAQEMERRFLARELHDDLGQCLNAVKIGLQELNDDLTGGTVTRESITELIAMVDESIRSARNLSAGLRPPALERYGLVKSIENLCERLESRYNLHIRFVAAGLADLQLDESVSINIFRIVQEALNNVIKHSGAKEAEIRIVASHPSLLLRIEDRGSGFNAEEWTRRPVEDLQLGLVGIAERVDLLKGTLQVISRPGEGTRVVVEIPYVRNPQKYASKNRRGEECR